MQCAVGPLGGPSVLMCRTATTSRLGVMPTRLSNASVRNNLLRCRVFGGNVRRKSPIRADAIGGIVCSATPAVEVSLIETLNIKK